MFLYADNEALAAQILPQGIKQTEVQNLFSHEGIADCEAPGRQIGNEAS